jgi:hypothetical protein
VPSGASNEEPPGLIGGQPMSACAVDEGIVIQVAATITTPAVKMRINILDFMARSLHDAFPVASLSSNRTLAVAEKFFLFEMFFICRETVSSNRHFHPFSFFLLEYSLP